MHFTPVREKNDWSPSKDLTRLHKSPKWRGGTWLVSTQVNLKHDLENGCSSRFLFEPLLFNPASRPVPEM